MIRNALKEVPIGKENRERVLGGLKEGEGNPDLEGYDCVIWTIDAMRKLDERGIIHLDKDPAGMSTRRGYQFSEYVK